MFFFLLPPSSRNNSKRKKECWQSRPGIFTIMNSIPIRHYCMTDYNRLINRVSINCELRIDSIKLVAIISNLIHDKNVAAGKKNSTFCTVMVKIFREQVTFNTFLINFFPLQAPSIVPINKLVVVSCEVSTLCSRMRHLRLSQRFQLSNWHFKSTSTTTCRNSFALFFHDYHNARLPKK